MHLYVWMDALSSNRKYGWWKADKPFFGPESRPFGLKILPFSRKGSTFSAWKFSFRAEKVPFQGPYFLFDSAHADMRNSNLCTNVQYLCYVTADAWHSNMYVFLLFGLCEHQAENSITTGTVHRAKQIWRIQDHVKFSPAHRVNITWFPQEV